jgi:hypothetical protein
MNGMYFNNSGVDDIYINQIGYIRDNIIYHIFREKYLTTYFD